MSNPERGMSRRRFGQAVAGAGAVAAAPTIIPSSALGQFGGNATAPSDRIIMGGIGLRGRGLQDLRNFLPNDVVQFVGICDIREEAREDVKSAVDDFYGNNDCQMFNNAAQILERDDIEAFLVATSDRWHACMASWVAQAGKDMYCEKPAAITIAESIALGKTCSRYGTVYQSGCQRRNGFNFEFAVGLARSGKLGKITEVHADVLIEAGSFPSEMHSWLPEEPEPDPSVFDWNEWLGPCCWRPFASYQATNSGGFGSKNSFWDFHGGLLEWASHTVALCQWVAESEHTQAVEYAPEGAEYVNRSGYRGEYTVNARYANGIRLVLRRQNWLGLGSCSNRFVGTEGWVETGDGGQIEVSDNLKSLLPTHEGPRSDATVEHIREFLHSVRSRTQPRGNAVNTANTHITSHAAYIACQLGRRLEWDPAKLEFVNDEQANRMRARAYREPWRLEALAATM